MKPLYALVAGVLVLAACKDEGGDGKPQGGGDGRASGPVDTTQFEAPSPVSAASFVLAMLGSDKFALKSARLAVERTRQDAVRDFAREAIAAHSASSTRLKAVALREDLPLQAALSSEQQVSLKLLRDAADADFDRLYIDQQLNAHQQALQTLENFAASDGPAALKQIAADAEPDVRAHLDHARRLSAGH